MLDILECLDDADGRVLSETTPGEVIICRDTQEGSTAVSKASCEDFSIVDTALEDFYPLVVLDLGNEAHQLRFTAAIGIDVDVGTLEKTLN